jgi:uncharacterized membrane protein YiaA
VLYFSKSKKGSQMNTTPQTINQPSPIFVLASWIALGVGFFSYLIALWNASIELNEKGYYFALLIFGLFAAVSLQKSLRDRIEGVAVTNSYLWLCWGVFLTAVFLLIIGLLNSSMLLSEKGFYAIAFFLTLYASITVQKNIRDLSFASLYEREQSEVEELSEIST